MIKLDIPGKSPLTIEYLVLDVNGTLALDGNLLNGVEKTLNRLKDRVEIHLVTADTHGKQTALDEQLHLRATRLERGGEAEQKANFVQKLGAEHVLAIGQGANDAGMIQEAAIGICVLSKEGTAVTSLIAADLVMPDILSALELLEKPQRLVATLRK